MRRSAIDFYLYASHEIETWHPIIESLRQLGGDARYVLEPPSRHLARGTTSDPRRGWKDDKKGPTVRLVTPEVHAHLAGVLESLDERPLRRRRRHATAVTTQGQRWMRVYAGGHVRTMYGVGFAVDSYGHGPVNADFDLVLAHGRFSADRISESATARVELIGYPKWAAHRRGELDTSHARQRLGLGAVHDQIVAWLPTWAHNSSLDEYLDAVTRLAETHAVMIKPHHNSAHFEAARLDAARDAGVTVLPVTASLVDVISAADIVLVDPRSGSFTESILADRAIVALMTSTTDRAQLHPGAAECAVFCEDPADLDRCLLGAFEPRFSEGRARWGPRLFEPFGGHDDDVAAALMLEVARRRVGLRRHGNAVAWSIAYGIGRRLER